jgi:hypothetical protein
MSHTRTRGLTGRCLSTALAGLLAITQAQAAEQAAVPTQAAPAQTAPAEPGAQNPQQTAPPQPPAEPPAQLPVEQSLHVRVLAGSDEQNDLERRIMAPLVVQVTDRDERPMEGADVVFRFPINGAGATFAGGRTSVSVRTNTNGQAAALNWIANGQVGKFQVHVNASYGNQVGEATLSMSNVTRVVEVAHQGKGKSWWSHTWVKVAVIGGGASVIAIAVVLATRGGGGGKSSGGSTTISPGSPTVGAP